MEQENDSQEEDEDNGFKTKIEPATESCNDSFGETYLSLRSSETGSNVQPHYAKLTVTRASEVHHYRVQLGLKASMEVCCKVSRDDTGNGRHVFENATSRLEVESAVLLLRAIPEPI